MNRMMMLGGAALLALTFESGAQANPAILDCYNAKGHVVACRGDFPDAERAARAKFTLFNKDRAKPGTGSADEHGAYPVNALPDEYIVVVAPPSLLSSLPSTDTAAGRSRRPGVGGEWVDVAAVDTLDKLQLWRDQYLSEKAPLIEQAEANFAR